MIQCFQYNVWCKTLSPVTGMASTLEGWNSHEQEASGRDQRRGDS